ncbi:MAG: N-acetyl-gamma-glutamyl-phosphate reductase [Oscillospiraceae bacterium]|nr:N-acetyl-gamma-glutamyl-phosphate reductase [Oscillospiraceae bacterium]
MNKKIKVFIDGEVGTVGLNIRERLENQNEETHDVELLQIGSEMRKDVSERAKLLNAADFVFLCLPDEEARRAVALIDETGNTHTRVIDASTAHRIKDGWIYGFPELDGLQAEKIRASGRVAVPGCYASGFIALINPLIQAGVLDKSETISCFGISGYSGAGKAAIAEYEAGGYSAARLYALAGKHKHLPEMQSVCGLESPPVFMPVIDTYHSGMTISIPISAPRDVYVKHYKNTGIKIMETDDVDFLPTDGLAGSDSMEIYVFPKSLVARFDNLGKGASGAAVQCFNLMKGWKFE